MKKIYFLFFTLIIANASFGQLTAGDLAFIAYNGDGDDEFAVVVLADIPANTSIWFTDNEWDGDSFNNLGEGEIEWSHSAVLPAGSVIIIQGNSGTLVSSIGTVSGNNANLGASNETIFALLAEPSDMTMPTPGFLAGFSNDLAGSGAVLTGTGLTVGTNFIDFGNDNDGFKYIGPRNNQASFSGYLPLIMNINNNWQVESDDGTLIIPISEVAFIENSMATPSISITSPSNMSVLSAGTISVDVEWTIFNANGNERVDIIVNGALTTDVTSPFSIQTIDGETYNVEVILVDGQPLDSDSISFSVEFPCDLQIGTITTTCDAETTGTDTYTVTIDYTNGAGTTYTINTQGNGTVGGDDPSITTNGIIVITDIAEVVDFDVIFTGDSSNSSCDFSIPITSPTCVPAATCPNIGDLIITEIMKNPNAVGDSSGEYFEVYNMTNADIDMIGMIISDLDSDSHTIATSLIVQATGYAVLGINSDITTNGGVTVDYEYSGIAMANSADEIQIDCGGTIIDLVAYSNPDFPNTAGAAMELSTTTLNATDNDTGSNWGDATNNLTGGDLGSPGSANDFVLSNVGFNISKFSIFPNPTNTGQVTISSVNSADINVTIFDMLGKQVKNETISNNTLNVSNLRSGIYLLNIEQDGATSTKKLVIK